MRLPLLLWLVAGLSAAQPRAGGVYARVPLPWSQAIGHALASPEAMSLSGVIPSLRGVDLADARLRASAAPLLQQLQLRGYEPAVTGSGRFILNKGGSMPGPSELKEDLAAAASDAAAAVRAEAARLSAEDEKAEPLERALKLARLSSSMGVYLEETERTSLAAAALAARSRLKPEDARRLEAALARMASALGAGAEDGGAGVSASADERTARDGIPELPASALSEPARASQEALARRLLAAARADPDISALLRAGGAFYAAPSGSPLAAQDAQDAQDHRNNVESHDGSLPAIADASGRSLRLGLSADGLRLTLTMRPQFVGEDRGRAKVYPPPEPKAYLRKDSDKEEFVPIVRDGRIYDRKGRPYHGVLNFVLDPQGRLFVREARSDIAHSSFVAGGPAAAAGELVVWQGKVVAVGPQTGHYGVTGIFILQALLDFKSRGIALEGATLLPLIPWNGAETLFARLRASAP